MYGAARLHSRKLSLFGILSLLDFFLTWKLVQGSGGAIYESNPVASAWLAAYGWIGLVFFKACMVALIGTVVILISVYRPDYGGKILVFACSVTAAVVAYSFYLTRVADSPGSPYRTDSAIYIDASFFRAQALERKRRDFHYLQLVNRLSGDLQCSRDTLYHAVTELAYRKPATPPRDLQGYRLRYPGHPEREYIAMHLANYCMSTIQAMPSNGRVSTLSDQFKAMFGRPLPAPATPTHGQ